MNSKYIYTNTFILTMILFVFFYSGYIWMFSIILPYSTYYLLKYKSKAKVMIVTFALMVLINYELPEEINENYHHTAVVDDVYTSSITVIEDGQKYYLMGIEENLSHGDVISYTSIYDDDVEKGGFDIFYKSTDAIGLGWANNLELVERNDDIRSNIHNDLYNEEGWYSDFTLLMLYGEENGHGYVIKNKINLMGISHLFVVSGFHISLFYILIDKILSGLISNSKITNTLAFSISVGFLYLVYFPPTGLRALLTIVFIRFLNQNKIESLSLTGLTMFVFNPWILLSNSMILSFSITYAIYIYKPDEISIIDMLVLSMFAFYISLPTISTWENKHNITAPLLSIVMTPLVSVFYITSLIILPFHDCWHLMDPVYHLFYSMINIFGNVNFYFYTPEVNFIKQITFTCLSLYFIYLLKNNKIILMNSFFLISLIIILI